MVFNSVFQHYFSYIAAVSAPIHAFPGVSVNSTLHCILSKPLESYNHCRNTLEGDC